MSKAHRITCKIEGFQYKTGQPRAGGHEGHNDRQQHVRRMRDEQFLAARLRLVWRLQGTGKSHV